MSDDVIKIYVGTDAHMKKAEIALEYSIRAHTKSKIDIVWMDASRGGIWSGWGIGREAGNPYSADGWSTDFTNFRFAIPEANEFKGRAIYLDADMILVRDIKELFDMPMKRPCMRQQDNMDVILYDCSAFKDLPWWPSMEEMKTNGWNLSKYSNLLMEHTMAAAMPLIWDCQDGKNYDPARTGLIHYTDMNTQPWKPYPEVFKYPPHPRPDMVALWEKYYQEGLAHLKSS